MRERTTWNRQEIAKAASPGRTAEDPRAMNQDHLQQQPAADAYGTGGPSEFAEDVHPPEGTWKAEQAGGETDRNEIGMPNMRGDTFKNAGYDDETLNKKAEVCIKVARGMLPTAAESVVEDQAYALMHLPDVELIETATRLAKKGEVPPEFLEQQQKMKDKAKAKNGDGDDDGDDDDKKDAQKAASALQAGDRDKAQQIIASMVQRQVQAAQQKKQQDQDEGDGDDDDGDGKQAGELPPALKKHMEEKKKENGDGDDGDDGDDEGKQAAQKKKQQDQDQEGQQGQGQGQQQEGDDEGDQQGQQGQQQKQGTGSGTAFAIADQVQQMVQRAVQQQMPQQGMQQPQQQPQQGASAIEGLDAGVLSDDQMLDQMLQDQTGQGQQAMPEMDVQLDGAIMDIGETPLGPEDEVLTQLFASNPEVMMAQQAEALRTGIPVQQPAPVAAAGTTRTASTRTVGTRPTGGVSQLGGAAAASATSQGGEIDKLASMWKSAPDMSGVFNGE